MSAGYALPNARLQLPAARGRDCNRRAPVPIVRRGPAASRGYAPCQCSGLRSLFDEQKLPDRRCEREFTLRCPPSLRDLGFFRTIVMGFNASREAKRARLLCTNDENLVSPECARRDKSADPQFADFENGDFRLKPNSPALALGFQPIDMSLIGLRPRADEQENSPLLHRRRGRPK